MEVTFDPVKMKSLCSFVGDYQSNRNLSDFQRFSWPLICLSPVFVLNFVGARLSFNGKSTKVFVVLNLIHLQVEALWSPHVERDTRKCCNTVGDLQQAHHQKKKRKVNEEIDSGFISFLGLSFVKN